MAPVTHSLDLVSLALDAGEGRRLDLEVPVEALEFGGQRYLVGPARVPLRLDVSRTTGDGWALRLRFSARLNGPCMRCLEPAELEVAVDAREVHQPNSGEELSSPYLASGVLDLVALARDALVLALPAQLVCSSDCAGLCAICGTNLNNAGAQHHHEREPDPRWEKLRDVRFE